MLTTNDPHASEAEKGHAYEIDQISPPEEKNGDGVWWTGIFALAGLGFAGWLVFKSGQEKRKESQ